MSGRRSRNKGANGEREFLNLLRNELGDDTINRNLAQSRDGGADCLNLAGVSLEIKRQENPKLGYWLEQARTQANGRLPALAYRKSREPWRIVLEFRLEEFCKFVREQL